MINALPLPSLEGAQPMWMAELTATLQDQIAATMRDQLKEFFTPIKADINNMKAGVEATRADINIMKNDIKATMADIVKMKVDIETAKVDINTLKNNMGDVMNITHALRNDIEQLRNKASDIEKQQGLTRRLAAIVRDCPIYPSCSNIDVHYQLYNRSQGTAGGVELEVVPFKDGDNPTKAPVST